MSIYSIITEQGLINLPNLAAQQKNQGALKIKNEILKQTHDIKLGESLSPITKKLDEVKISTQKLGDIDKESNTPQLATENNHNALLMESERIQHGVIYDTSLENKLSNMKNNTGFFNIEEKKYGDIIWKGFPVEKCVVKNLKVKRRFMIYLQVFKKF